MHFRFILAATFATILATVTCAVVYVSPSPGLWFSTQVQARLQALKPLLLQADNHGSEVRQLADQSVEIIDPSGQRQILTQPPQALVSAMLAGDEMLAVLAKPEHIRSVSHLADIESYSNVAGFYPQGIARNQGKTEQWLAANPDLVLVASYSDINQLALLLNTGIAVLRFGSVKRYDDLRNNVRRLALVLGNSSGGERWLAAMDARIDAVQQTLQQHRLKQHALKQHALKQQIAAAPRVLYYSADGNSVGPDTLMDETITLAGGRNVLAEAGLNGFQRISLELAIALQPDVILFDTNSLGPNPPQADIDQVLAPFYQSPAWAQVPAVQNRRVYALAGPWLSSATPWRVTSVEQIAALLYPQLFPSFSPAQAAKEYAAEVTAELAAEKIGSF